jgi:hypothetical protein
MATGYGIALTTAHAERSAAYSKLTAKLDFLATPILYYIAAAAVKRRGPAPAANLNVILIFLAAEYAIMYCVKGTSR